MAGIFILADHNKALKTIGDQQGVFLTQYRRHQAKPAYLRIFKAMQQSVRVVMEKRSSYGHFTSCKCKAAVILQGTLGGLNGILKC